MIGWAAPAATSPASHGLAQRSRFPSPCPLPPILPHPTRAATAVRRVWASLCRLPAGRSYSPARETPVHTCAHLSTPEHTQKKHETQPPPSLLLCLLCQSPPPRNLPEWLGWWRQGPQRPARSGPSPAAWPPPARVPGPFPRPQARACFSPLPVPRGPDTAALGTEPPTRRRWQAMVAARMAAPCRGVGGHSASPRPRRQGGRVHGRPPAPAERGRRGRVTPRARDHTRPDLRLGDPAAGTRWQRGVQRFSSFPGRALGP